MCTATINRNLYKDQSQSISYNTTLTHPAMFRSLALYNELLTAPLIVIVALSFLMDIKKQNGSRCQSPKCKAAARVLPAP